jgi:DNA-binding CsgD family transcriptional regulator
VAAISERGGSRRLLGRQQELAAIGRWLDEARAGRGRLVIVRAGAGLGKTSLLGAAADHARREGVTVYTARAAELEQSMPLGVVRQLFERPVLALDPAGRAAVLRAGAAHVEQLLGLAPGSAWPGDLPGRLHALYWLVVNLSERGPVVIVVDDLHWSDVQTIHWLAYLAPRLTDLPVTVLAAMRPLEDGSPDALKALADAERVTTLGLDPLQEAHVEELVVEYFGRPADPSFVTACWRLTAGNPLFVRELLRAALQDGIDLDAPEALRLEHLGSREITRSILVRLGRLGDPGRRLAEAAAVLGVDAELRLAACLADLEPAEALATWDRLVTGEILDDGQPLQFIHPIARAAVYHELQVGRRTELHRRAAALLAADGADAARIALHALACTPAGDALVVGWLRNAAAEATASGAAESAVQFLERAVAEPPAPEVRSHVLFELGRALIGLDITRAAEVLGDAARGAGPELAVHALRWRGYALAYSIEVGEAVASFDSAISLTSGVDDARLSLRGTRDYYACFWPSDPDPLARHARLQRDVEALTGATAGERRLMAAAAMSSVRLGDRCAAEVEALARQAYPSAASWVDPEFGEETASAVGNALTYCDTPECGDLFTRWMGELRDAGRFVNFGCEYFQRAMIHYRRGSLVEAEADARASWEILRPLQTAASHPHWRSAATLLQVLVGRGALDEAVGLAAEASLGVEPFDTVISPWPPLVRGELALACGRIEEGIGILLTAGEWLESRAFLNPSFVPWRAMVAPAMAATDRREEARAIIRPAVDRARAFGVPWAYGMALRAAGIVAGGSSGIELLRQAVEVLDRSPCRLEHARSLFALGGALRRANRRVEAREHLRASLDLARRCGATPLLEAARAELSRTGARPRAAAFSGRDSLTASERRVAELAAAGLSNREIAQRLFVTCKTVETHLGHVYVKLGIASRQQLGAALSIA